MPGRFIASALIILFVWLINWILLRVIARRFLIPSGSFQPIIYTTVGDNDVLLTLRYLCDPCTRRGRAEAT